jgi:lipopolysaccharide transport system permease protein
MAIASENPNSVRPASLADEVSFREVRQLMARREIILQFARRNLLARYRGSVLGLLWFFGTPLLMLAVYTFVFSVVFRAKWGLDEDAPRATFAVALFCGTAVFSVFSETLNAAAGVIVSNVNLVKRVVFPLEILPISGLLTASALGAFWLVVIVLASAALVRVPGPTLLALPLVVAPLLVMTAGLAWFVASLGVYFRDLPHVLAIVLQVLFFLTPIFYSVEMLPENLRLFVQLNPLAGVVENVRQVVLRGMWPDWPLLAAQFIASVVVFKAGYHWFMRTKRGFGDVI